MSPTEAPAAMLRDRRGSIAVEAALVLSLLAVAAVGAADGARYLQASARAERVAANIADMASRSLTLRDRPAVDDRTGPNDVGVFFLLARRIAEPDDLTRGGVTLSSVSGAADGLVVNWMRTDGAAADASAQRLAEIGALTPGADYIVAEVVLPFSPALLDRARFGAGLPDRIYRRAVFRTRSADLSILEPGA